MIEDAGHGLGQQHQVHWLEQPAGQPGIQAGGAQIFNFLVQRVSGQQQHFDRGVLIPQRLQEPNAAQRRHNDIAEH